MTKKAVIYARVSTEKQKDGYSLETQVAACKLYAAEMGFEVVGEYTDKLSGGHLERPELQRILSMAGEVDALICYVQDRLARTNEIDALYLIHDLSKKGMEVHFAHEGKRVETETFIGQLETLLRAKVAREERDKITERMMRGKRGKMQSGRVVSPAPVYGYDKTDDDHLVINLEEAEVVRKIYDLYLNGDENGRVMGFPRIAKRLSLDGILTPQDKRGYGNKRKQRAVWSVSSVSKIVKNTVYKGEWRGGTPPIIVPVPAIVDNETWEQAQKQGQRNHKYAQRNRKRSYLLTGIMSCLECGMNFFGLTHYKTKKVYYRCGGQMIANTRDFQTKNCFHFLIGTEVEEMIWAKIAEFLHTPELIINHFQEQLELQEADTKNLSDYIAYCETQIDKLTIQRAKLLDLYLADTIPKSLLDEKLYSIDNQLKDYDARHHELQQRLEVSKLTPKDFEEKILVFCRTIQAGIEHFTQEEKRAVIELLDIRIYVKRGKTRDEDEFELTGFIPNVANASTLLRKNGSSQRLRRVCIVMTLSNGAKKLASICKSM